MADAKIILSAVDQTKAAIESAQRNLSSLGDKASSLSGLMRGLGISVAVAFAAKNFIGLVDMLDGLDNMAEKTGISVESLSTLRYTSQAVSVSQDQLNTGLTRLAKTMADADGGNKEAIETFRAMDVSVTDANGKLRATDDVLQEVAQRFSGWENGPGKAAMAMRVFGKSGTDLIPLLNQGTSGLNSMANEATALGAVFGGDVTKNAAEFNNNLAKLKIAAQGLGTYIAGPLIKSLADSSQAFIDARKSGEGYLGILDRMASFMPKIPSILNGLPGVRFFSALQQSGDALKAPKTTAQIQAYVNKLHGAGGAGRGFVNPLVAAPRPKEEDPKKTPKAPDHFADNFINQLITEYANLSGSMSKTDEVTRKLDTSTEKFSSTERARALTMAGLIDRQKQINEDLNTTAVSMIAQLNEEAKLDDARQAAMKSLQQLTSDQQFELTLLNQTPEAIAKARFELDLNSKARMANAAMVSLGLQAGWDSVRMEEERTRILKESGAALSAFSKIQADQLDKQYNPQRGVADAIKDYMDATAKAGDAAKAAATRTMGSLEDGLTEFLSTAHTDTRTLVDGMISEFMRLQVVKPLMASLFGDGGIGTNALQSLYGGGGSMMSGIGSWLGGLFKFADGGQPPVGVPSIVGERGPELFIPHSAGTIIPNDALRGGSSQPPVIVNNNFTVGDVASISMVRQAIAGSEKRMAGSLARSMRYGGSTV